MRVFNSDTLYAKLPIKSWCENPDEGTLEQACNLANLPFVYKWVALMPDTHKGYGMPIGGVIACDNVIIPNAIGCDIGCGVSAIRTSIESWLLNKNIIKDIFSKIRERIPVGFGHHRTKQLWEGFYCVPDIPIIKQELDSARFQLGTLGGGNHFIEIQKSEEGFIWVMLHSGSRNFGLKIANEYNKIAKELCTRWHSKVDVKGEDGLAFLPLGTKEAKDYFDAMKYAVFFAKENRYRMMSCIAEILSDMFTMDFTRIDVEHNYARFETHYNKNVIVHRKGAISAYENEIGIIPGSQGTNSYITVGTGNPESFKSSSHGAGRIMGRNEARKTLNLEAEQNLLSDIVHSVRNIEDLDEAPSAYKNIDKVMEEQKDLVIIKEKLTPLGGIKG